MATTFQYSRRLDGNHIRLLRIDAVTDSVLCCSLEEVSFNQPGQEFDTTYALSYCWGTEEVTEAIMIEGQPFRVRRNLLEALQALRSYTRARHIDGKFWIDAICINQDDNQEKSAQIDLMTDIYSKLKVLVWLGPAENGSDYVMAVFGWLEERRVYHAMKEQSSPISWLKVVPHLRRKRMLRDMANTPWHNARDVVQAAGVSQKNLLALERCLALISSCPQDVLVATDGTDLLPPDHQWWEFFLHLISRPWFTRVWTLQEILLPQDTEPEVMCGSFSVGWEVFLDCRRNLTSISITIADRLTTKVLGSIDRLSFLYSSNLCYLRIGEGVHETLRNLLIVAYGRKAADPKDYVYGLLGLAPPHIRSLVTKNYGSDWTVCDVFMEIVGLCCKSWHDKDAEDSQEFWPSLMEFTDNLVVRKTRIAGLPTWCPDFSAETGNPGFVVSGTIDPPIPPRWRPKLFVVRGRELIASGLKVDTIRSCTPSSASLADGVPSFEDNSFWKEPYDMFQVASQWLSVLSRTFDYTTERQWQRHHFFMDREATVSSDQLAEDFSMILKMINITSEIKLSKDEETLRHLGIRYDRYLDHISTIRVAIGVSIGRCFFRTTSGRLGCSLTQLTPGDLVCYFLGGGSFHILSPSQEHELQQVEPRYKWVGSASVVGLGGDGLINSSYEEWDWQEFVII